jgi:hypothetical protein
MPIRFKPLSFGAKAATITVTSDDPASPISINVSGEAPSGKLTVTGSTTFGGVNAGCCADRTLSICNTGDCALSVTSVHFRRRSRRWKLLNNPFPATASGFVSSGRHSVPPAKMPAAVRADDRKQRSGRRSSTLRCWRTRFGMLAAKRADGRHKEERDDCRKNCCDKHPPAGRVTRL